jgi:hypothetical protein
VLDVGEHEGRPFLVMEEMEEMEENASDGGQGSPPDQAATALGAVPGMIRRALRAIPRAAFIQGTMGILLLAVAVWMVTWPKPAAYTAAPAPSVAPAPSAAPSVRPSAVPVTPSPTAPATAQKTTGGTDDDVITEKVSRKQGKGNSENAPGRSRGLGKGQLKKQ